MEIQMEINGQKVHAKKGATIMQVAAELGLYIPHFCYHPKLSIAANCRMCLVEVAKSPKPLPACATAATDGMVVYLDSPKAKEAQNSVMEFLLINHPLDCPICDQGGECQLQDLAVGYGMSKSRYTEEKRVVFEKNLGPLISTDMTRCIHCTRCVRFGREVGGIMEMGMAGRGEHAEIMPFIEKTVDSELSGNMIDVCPVGALTSKPFRFTARPWELTSKPGLSPHDSWGSNLVLQVKGAEIKRVTPRGNAAINECWISDRDRFSYLGMGAADRILRPMLRQAGAKQFNEVAWSEALSLIAKQLKNRIGKHGAKKAGFFITAGATAEEMFLWQKLARGLGCDNIDSRLRQRDFSIAGPTQLGFRIADIGRAGAVLLVGVSPAREQPLLAARFRQTRNGRRRLMSIGAMDISGQLPLAAQHVAAPAAIGARLSQLNCLLGLSAQQPGLLFEARGDATLKQMSEYLKNARGGKHIILGDAACEAEDYGRILHEAEILAAGTGASLGVLSAGANGAGARRYGVFPQTDGAHTAAMLDAGLETVMLFNCEPQDFAETARAETMLAEAGFVGAISAYLGGIKTVAGAVLPLAVFGENEGTYLNGEGVAQTITAAVPPPQQARPGWKVLRVLGEALGLSGFDFSTLEEVRQLMTAVPETPPLTDTPPTPAGNNSDSAFQLIGGAAIYNSDGIVRRSPALQASRQGRDAVLAFMHPDDMRQCALAEGGAARLGDGDNTWDTHVFADKRLARGAILAYPPNLRPGGIAVEALTEQQQAAG